MNKHKQLLEKVVYGETARAWQLLVEALYSGEAEADQI